MHCFLLSSECICFMHTLILELHTAVWFLPQGFHAIGNLTEYSILSCSMEQLLSCFVSFSTTTAVHCGCVSSWELMALSVDHGCYLLILYWGYMSVSPTTDTAGRVEGMLAHFTRGTYSFHSSWSPSTEVLTVCSCSFIYIDSGWKEKGIYYISAFSCLSLKIYPFSKCTCLILYRDNLMTIQREGALK